MTKKRTKKSISTKKFMAICIPSMASLTALVLVATILMNNYSTVMGSIFGFGEMVQTKVKGSEGLDANYIKLNTSNYKDSTANAKEVTQTIEGEGATLLKNENNALPLSKGAAVTLFGIKTISMNMSGGENIKTEGGYSIDDALTKKGFKVNPATVDYYTSQSKTKQSDIEPEVSAYASMESTYANYSDAAIVTFERNSGEGNDQTKSIAGDNGRTGLSLSSAELNMLQYACSKFKKVIVLINASNTMELGFIKDGSKYHDKYTGKDYDFSNIKAALWVGGVGSTGCLAVADILQGVINPSGHLVDTYVRDLTQDPSFKNVGDYQWTNVDYSSGNYYAKANTNAFVEYEEGIYVGYRYYETAAKEAKDGNYSGFNYDNAVIYPFGYGLSYTTFSMAYEGTPTYDSSTNKFTFKVKVTNTGNVAGKKVVEIYCNEPYTKGGVEKAQVILAGYAKTSNLKPGASEVVNVTVDRDYITSYDYKSDKSYILDAGNYNFYLSDDSHSWASIEASDSSKYYTYTLNSKIVFNKDNKRPSDGTAAVNQFDDISNYLFKDKQTAGYATNFSRADFKGTFPTSPTTQDSVANEKTLEQLKKYDVTKAKETVKDTPTTDYLGTKIQLIDLRGKDINDTLWNSYIQQFSVQSLYNMYKDGAWVEHADSDQGVPESIDMDGPYGFFGHTFKLYVNKWYQSETITAATWNVEMAKLMGESIGEEANNQTTKLTGWYGPGVNIHRSAFGGRNYEYFSEDPLLSGYICAAETGAASSKGLITFTKHFALNDQETNRTGVSTFANEQAMREIYLKAFEIYVKDSSKQVNYYENENGKLVMKTKTMSGATGVMSSYNRVGATWSGACAPLMVNVLRNEWKFTGTSLTDAGGGVDNYMNTDYALRSGGTDLFLGTHTLKDYQSASAIASLQQAVKHILYNKANSNIMTGLVPGSTISYTLAPWQIGLIVAGVVVGIIDVLGIVLIVRKVRQGKKQQDKVV
ncbi:beta-glucosidase [Clostridium fungisolvens]|uniref:Fibronectin type III-like domain-containing protein n=1 Tax=Clostridium fungisolvens TaxID=1604897 RepID=A0A6V8SID4_9CLOT|nr:glycoside hydrolase family 3 C-terminal domain-containing protein [Clostridium fungisolvens]GFP76531.1 hypothetical protein bsdtw1_02634 [Clostridium fungisolvens]